MTSLEMAVHKSALDERALPLYRRIAYATGNFINVLAISVWFPYNVSFFQKVIELPPRSAGTIVLIAQIGGAVSTPFIGQWSDQCICRYPGRRKVFQLVGVLAVASSFFFIWHDCLGCTNAPDSYKVLYYSSFAIIFEFGWAATQIGQLALIPELTSDKSVQVELNSIRYAFALIANLLVFSCFWVLLGRFSSSVDGSDLSPSDKKIFWIMALVVIGVGVPVSMVFQCLVPEVQDNTPPKCKWYKWLINPRFYLVCLGYIAARFVVILYQTYQPLYYIDTLMMDKTSIAKGPIVFYISSFIVTVIVKRFSKVIGDKMTFFIGLTLVWGGLIWLWVKGPTQDQFSHFNWQRDSIYGATILLGGGGAIMVVISMTMIAYVIGPYKGSGAFVYGWVAFSDRLSNGVAVKVIQQFQPAAQTGLPSFYRHVLIGVSFTGTAIGLFVITAMLLLDWKDQRKLMVETPVHDERVVETSRQLSLPSSYGAVQTNK